MFNLRNITGAKRLVILVIVFVLLLSFLVVHFADQYRAKLYEAKKDNIVNVVESVYSTISSYDKMAKEGLITEEEARSLALTLIKSARYSGDHYFWVQDEQSNMIVHAINSNINGKNMSSTTDVQGYPLFSEMSHLGRSKGQGFVQFHAIKPGGDEHLLKITYVHNYRPWGWIIGTGVYVDDIDNLVMTTLAMIIGAFLVAIAVLAILTLYIPKRFLKHS